MSRSVGAGLAGWDAAREREIGFPHPSALPCRRAGAMLLSGRKDTPGVHLARMAPVDMEGPRTPGRTSSGRGAGMRRFSLALLLVLALGGLPARAGLFDRGIGGAMYYGPYTGGHAYSYNVAYSYGFAFSPADTWRRDPVAYPAGIYPYRPYG